MNSREQESQTVRRPIVENSWRLRMGPEELGEHVVVSGADMTLDAAVTMVQSVSLLARRLHRDTRTYNGQEKEAPK